MRCMQRYVNLLVRLNLGKQLLVQLAELFEVSFQRGPANDQAGLFVALGDQVKVNVVDDLVRNSAIVLQHVVADAFGRVNR